MLLTNLLANLLLVTALWAALLPAGAAWALEDPPAQNPADGGAIAKWIKQLDSNRFAERNEASKNLEAAGESAFPALTEAALGDSREVTLRAIDILRKHFAEGNEATKKAARQALEKLAGSDHPSAARRAKDVLKPKPPAQPAILPGIQIGGGQIQIQVNAVAGRPGQRVQTKIVNGVKEIEVQEKDRKVKITEDPAGGIKMEVTEKKDGKETTKKYAAKNADQLKKNDAEAYKIYEKYSKGAGGRIQIQAFPARPGRALRIAPRAVPVMPVPLAKRGAAARLSQARRLIEATAKQLKGNDAGEKSNKSAKRLEEIAKQIQEVEGELSKGD